MQKKPAEKARAAIERLLKKKPESTTEDCRRAAVRHDPAAKKAAPRSFNARYVLPVKRKLSPPKPKKRRTKRRAAKRSVTMSPEQRLAVRQLVLERDERVIATLDGHDTQAAYALAAEIDQYIDEIQQEIS